MPLDNIWGAIEDIYSSLFGEVRVALLAADCGANVHHVPIDTALVLVLDDVDHVRMPEHCVAGCINGGVVNPSSKRECRSTLAESTRPGFAPHNSASGTSSCSARSSM